MGYYLDVTLKFLERITEGNSFILFLALVAIYFALTMRITKLEKRVKELEDR